MKLLLATGNQGKVEEILEISRNLVPPSASNFQILSLSEVGFKGEMPDETGLTYEENSRIKARAIAVATGFVTIADDSGLEVDALDGRPGLYSSRYGDSDDGRIRRLLQELSGCLPASARFVCVASVVHPSGFVQSFEGSIEGEITGSRAGNSGFGFDPVFRIAAKDCTMAELSVEDKNRISHRAVAFSKLFSYVCGEGRKELF